MKALLDFVILCRGMTTKDRIKLLLFALGLRPATSVYLCITPDNLKESFLFEHTLRMYKIIYLRGREKSFEEVKKIQHNKIVWDVTGLWIDYDLFHTVKQKEQFIQYRKLWQLDKERNKRNTIAGKLYDYPLCCITQYNKETPRYICKNVDSYAFYNRMHVIDKKFSLLSYAPCSLLCKNALSQQNHFATAIRNASLSFWNHLHEVDVYETDVIVESENDIIVDGKSIWKTKNGHDYIVLAVTPFHGKHWFYTVLSKKPYPVGTVLSATIKQYATYGEVLLGREKGYIKDLHHERNLPLLRREY